MSIVDRWVLKYERLDGDIDELVSAELARILEQHAEAMYLGLNAALYSGGESEYRTAARAYRAYEKFRKERGG